jgi:hypothetical protein
MIKELTLEEKISKNISEKVSDKKYNFLYNSLRNDFIQFKKIHSKLEENYDISDFDNDPAYYFNSQMNDFEFRFKRYFKMTGIDQDIFGHYELFNIDKFQIYLNDNSKLIMDMKVYIDNDPAYYFSLELNEKDIKVKFLIQ